MRPPAILKRAACAGADTELFFPVGTQQAGYTAAMQYCVQCPVWRACLNYALSEHIDDGVWGGSIPEHRAQMREGKIDAALFEPGHADKRGTEAGYLRERRLGVPNCDDCTAAVSVLVAERKRIRKEKAS